MRWILQAALGYSRWSMLLMYLLPPLLLGPFFLLLRDVPALLRVIALFLLFFGALGWMKMLGVEDREHRLALLAVLPVSKRRIALARQLATLIHQAAGLLPAMVIFLAAGLLEARPMGDDLRFLLGSTGSILLATQVVLLAEELKYLAVGSRLLSVAAGFVPMPFYMLAMAYTITFFDGGEPESFGFLLHALVEESPLGIVLLFVVTALLAVLAVSVFARRRAYTRVPWMSLDGWPIRQKH